MVHLRWRPYLLFLTRTVPAAPAAAEVAARDQDSNLSFPSRNWRSYRSIRISAHQSCRQTVFARATQWLAAPRHTLPLLDFCVGSHCAILIPFFTHLLQPLFAFSASGSQPHMVPGVYYPAVHRAPPRGMIAVGHNM